jgi:hypothetical protein
LSSVHYSRTLGPGQTGSSQIEAYEFIKPQDQSQIIVAWSKDEATHPFGWKTTQLLTVDKFGVETVILDGDDGVMDGRVRVMVGPSPLYLHPLPSVGMLRNPGGQP